MGQIAVGFNRAAENTTAPIVTSAAGAFNIPDAWAAVIIPPVGDVAQQIDATPVEMMGFGFSVGVRVVIFSSPSTPGDLAIKIGTTLPALNSGGKVTRQTGAPNDQGGFQTPAQNLLPDGQLLAVMAYGTGLLGSPASPLSSRPGGGVVIPPGQCGVIIALGAYFDNDGTGGGPTTYTNITVGVSAHGGQLAPNQDVKASNTPGIAGMSAEDLAKLIAQSISRFTTRVGG